MFAGLAERLLVFDIAVTELRRELSDLRPPAELAQPVARARSALDKADAFARTELDVVERRARDVAPLAKETQLAWSALRTVCDARRDADCVGVREVLVRFDSAETPTEHAHAVQDLAALKLPVPTVARARDRAVAASRAVQDAMPARADSIAALRSRWSSVRTSLTQAVGALEGACRGAAPAEPSTLASAEHPDPRKLTVLLHVKPTVALERVFVSLAASAPDEDDRDFYRARANGAYGSGFFVVRKRGVAEDDVLVVTNRHVVDLGDRASLSLADGTPLGDAEIVYASPIHDLAILRPSKKALVAEGFPLARSKAIDQQTVIATGFPGLVGRPSYQSTRGYVSNESFELEEGGRALTYLQHTAPIDPGSSGGPLTDERGRVLGVNTLKVRGRDSVALAVPSRFVVDTLRTVEAIESRRASSADRQSSARLACLALVGELGAAEPRLLVLEQMISNHLVGVSGKTATAALAGEDGFEQLWNADSVRAMRIATLVSLRASFVTRSGPSVLETCDDEEVASRTADHVTFHVRLGNFELHDVAFRWEHGRWKVDGFDPAHAAAKPSKRPQRKLPPPGPPSGKRPSKRVLAPK